ncbi:MAG TPA: outer membrane protein transport protein [Thiobacillus sp.]|nr:outer membrane protein transport protein [Thiobacillus sp.]
MKLTRVFAFMALAGLAGSAFATNGYFSHGYGMKSKGMAGVSTTSTEDAFGGANNPAAMAFAGNRFDLGVDLFSPQREASRTGSTGMAPFFPPIDGSSESDSNYFLIPELGYTHQVSSTLAAGVTVYGNGGMNTDYPAFANNCGSSNLLCGQGDLGVDLIQLIVAPTIAYKVAPNHSIGVSPLLGYQAFEARGLHAFEGITSSPGNVTNNGHDDAFGYGVRIGYLGKVTPTVTIGAAYASKMDFQEFDDYRGLFAEQGDFDIPENYNLGASWQATQQIRLAVDYQRINYSDVAAVANPSGPAAFACFMGDVTQCLGTDGGSGFGWQDVDVWKIGVEHKLSPNFTLRAGYSHTDQPIPSADVEFNILAPAVIEDHVTVGFTYTLATGNELTMAYMHGFSNDVTGPSLFFGGQDKIEMYQDSLGIQYSWKM